MSSGKKAKKQRQRQQQQQPAKRPPGENRPSVPPARLRSLPPGNTLAALTLIIVIGLLSYSNTLNVPFVLDDNHTIFENPFIRLTRISVDGLREVLNSPGKRYFANLTFALNYYFHQYDETGYHLVNMAVHLLTAFLVFVITRQTLILCGLGNPWIAVPAALLWLVNPVHTQSVTYIVQRMNSLAGMFYLLAMVCYIQGRLIHSRDNGSSGPAILLFSITAAAGILGLFSKEIVATLPVMIFLFEWYFFRNLDRTWLKHNLKIVLTILLLFAIIAMISMGRNPLEKLTSIHDFANNKFTLGERMLTQPAVVVYYLSLIFYPSPERLRILYDLSPATTLFSAPVLLSFLALAGLVTVAVLLRHKNRLFSFAVAWFLINLIIESSIIPLALIFEYRTYLPSVFIFIALAALLFQRTTAPRALAAISAAVIICGAWTWQRNALWADKITFWQDAALKTPGDPRPHQALGLVHQKNGNLETAMIKFKEAMNQDPAYGKAYNHLGMALIDLKRPAEAVPILEKAIALNPDHKEAFYNLGQAYKDMGQTEKAESCYRKTLELNPLYEKAHNNIGLIKMDRGQTDEAIAHFERAITIDPDYEKPYNNLGITCFQKGETDRALAYFKKALALKPDYTEAAKNLERATRSLEKYGQPIARLRQARQERPHDMDIITQLAVVYQQAGMRNPAVDLYHQALLLDPACEKCLNALAGIYEETGRYKPAAQMLERLARRQPGRPRVFYRLARVYAQGRQQEKAVENLKKAVAAGFADVDYIRHDKSLALIRDTDYFQALTAGN